MRFLRPVAGPIGDGTTIFAGPHLHFEVRRYDTPIDPAPLLLATVAAGESARGAGVAAPALECAGRGEARRPPAGADWIARERLCAPR